MSVLAIWISLLATLLGPGDDPECYALGGLDVTRAQALADVNVTDLESVYAGANVADTDRKLLEHYAARGLRIVGAGMIRSSCRAIARNPQRVELDVTERLSSSWAVNENGAARRLPRDGFSRRRIVLTGGSSRWRVASVR